MVAVEILPDSTTMDICNALDEAGVIKNKYAFMLRLRIGEYGAKIMPGTYDLAPSYTNKKIIEVLTGENNTTNN